jgi:FkbM family methyltransferase
VNGGTDRTKKKPSKRAARVALQVAPREEPLTVFVHIPRTAGTTFASVLRDNFPHGVRTIGNAFRPSGGINSRALRRLDEAALLTRDASVLTGHVPFSVRDKLPPDTRYVTLLRDPIERTLSQYYGLVELGRRKPLPGDGSLEATLAAGDVIYDNLQTRMLSGVADPLGEVDEQLLEEAKENLRGAFTSFGIVERFDESLVLVAQSLGLESILYVRRRSLARPRGADVPDDMVRLAEGFNRYDIELYRWACELFEQRVADPGSEFLVELAALRAARDDVHSERPPAATLDELWALLVRVRADALGDRLDRASAGSTEADQIRAVLEQVRAQVGELGVRVPEPAEVDTHAAGLPPEAEDRSQQKRAASAVRVVEIEEALDETRLELEQIKDAARSIDESASDSARLASERLRAEAEQAERRLGELEQRLLRARAKLGKAAAAEALPTTPPPELEPELEPGSPEEFEERSRFFDTAETFTELVCARVGSARFLVRTQDKHVARALFLKQGRGDMKLLQRCATTVAALLGQDAIAGRLLIDVGANIGSTTINALHDGLFGHVLAIEPDPENFETLRLNLLLNGLEARATAIQAAASDVDGELSLVVNPTRSGKHRIASGDERASGAAEEKLTVAAVTLDSLGEEGVYDPADVGLVWIDAEGHEGHILGGATELTRRSVPVVFEWDPTGLDEGSGRNLISDALTGRYTHFADMRAAAAPGEPRYRLRPLDELAGYVRLAEREADVHFTDILALRLTPEQLPEDNLPALLRAHRKQAQQ